jgi:hypothetical protein
MEFPRSKKIPVQECSHRKPVKSEIRYNSDAAIDVIDRKKRRGKRESLAKSRDVIVSNLKNEDLFAASQ